MKPMNRIIDFIQTALPVGGGATGGALAAIKTPIVVITLQQIADTAVSAVVWSIIGSVCGWVIARCLNNIFKKK